MSNQPTEAYETPSRRLARVSQTTWQHRVEHALWTYHSIYTNFARALGATLLIMGAVIIAIALGL